MGFILNEDFLNCKPEELQQHVDSVQSTPESNQHKYQLGKIELHMVSNWVDNSTIIKEIPYSLTDTPIFTDFSKEDYIYYQSIPNMD
jgi:hypothetical protein